MINLQQYLKSFRKNKTFVNGIFIPSLIVILSISFFCAFFPRKALLLLNQIKEYIFADWSWFYIISVGIFLIFLIFIASSKYGNIRLGNNQSHPEHSFFSWIAMLFSAGMGIGLIYFGVAEPMAHANEPIFAAMGAEQSMKQAQLYTFFHWGIHAWAIYAVVGLVLAYFTYRYHLPLSLRSALYPLLKKRIYGPVGNIIDVFALCSTFFGITTTLGFGVVQLNAGLVNLGWVSESSFTTQIIIVVIIMTVAVASALSGLVKGIKLLSQINIYAAVLLMLFILIIGPTIFILSSFSDGIGNYITNFFTLTFSTHAYESEYYNWFSNWTILYWAWWISWSPYVGMFIAQISKGRTIREYIVAVLLIPSLFNFLWMTVFGNSALWIDHNSSSGVLSALVNNPDSLLFTFFNELPLSSITSIIAMIIITVFFVTSADSGILVMNNIASNSSAISPKWQKIFWGAMLALLSLILLNLGGLKALQTMTLISALPFTAIILLFCYSLGVGLHFDSQYHNRKFSHSIATWNGDRWKSQLHRILTFEKHENGVSFIKINVLSAFNDLCNEFKENNIDVKIIYNSNNPSEIELTIAHENMKDFHYGVKLIRREINENVINDDNTPDLDHEKTYIPTTFFCRWAFGL